MFCIQKARKIVYEIVLICLFVLISYSFLNIVISILFFLGQRKLIFIFENKEREKIKRGTNRGIVNGSSDSYFINK